MPCNRTMILLLCVLATLIPTYDSKCAGGFDIYFILDRSGSVSGGDFQVQTVHFVRNLTHQLNSPTSRISIVTFSDAASVHLPLTANRDEIQRALKRLETTKTGGATHIEFAMDEVMKQIGENGETSASIVIMLTDGELGNPAAAFKKSDFLRRQLTATVFAIGVAKYKLNQLNKLASKPVTDHVFTVTDFHSLLFIANKLVEVACVEVTDVEPKTVCVGRTYDVTLHGNGFTKISDQSNITCNFKYNNTKDHVTKPSQVSDNRLTCRAPVLESVDSFISVQVSLTRNKFISSDIRVVGVHCGTPDGKGVAIALTVFILFGLLTTWWFYLLFPCVQTKRKPPARPPRPARPPGPATISKWPTVDASFYGGGGVGGIKPVKVHWGDKGATEGGNKLTKSPDANVIEHCSVNQTSHVTDAATPRHVSPTLSERIVQLLGVARRVLDWLGRLCFILYKALRAFRPHKGGQSRFYSNASERKVLYG